MKKIDVLITFTGLSSEQMEHLHKAESELFEAGVYFDTGYDIGKKRRDWEFDWSLEGVEVWMKDKKK